MNASPNYVVDISVGDAPAALCEELSVADMTIPEFNAAIARIAASQSRVGGYAKVRGTFLYTHLGEDHEHAFRLDVDAAMSEGRTLAAHFEQRARFYETPGGVQYAEMYGENPSLCVMLYRTLTNAARVG